MDPNDELPSDSDASDDDYCPEDDSDHKNVSEEESGKEDDEDPNSGEDCPKSKQSKKKLKRRKTSANRSRKSLKLDNGKSEEKRVKDSSDSTSENEEIDKEKSDALWADFLNDEPAAAPKVETKKLAPVEKEKENHVKKVVESTKEKVVKVFEYAGETVTTVVEELKVETPVRLKPTIDKTPAPASSSALGKFVSTPRPKPAGGLGSILSQLGKKNKISTLEKTKLDWDGFKRNEGLDEELQTHNKGKDGFLERRDFLERTDYRQFEIEKNLRQGGGRRSNF